jgi:putative peptide zinc metalloprotease protein
MPALEDIPASTMRPLRLQMRPDLSISEHRNQGEPCWVVKDPIGLKYFRLCNEEYEILRMLDGTRSLEQIKRTYDSGFAPRRITTEDLARYVGHLHQSGLVHSLLPNQGTQLKRLRDKRKQQKLLGALADILAIRVRGIDPHRLLDWLLAWTGWLFTPLAAAAALVLGLSAALLVLVQLNTFQARMPAFQEFFASGNWGYLALTLAATKVLHELGHGISCRRFGGECHEIGLMLLVGTPCLYCDVSDSWMIKNKWQRAAIAAAGMYVELILASVATFVWWFSAPGLLNTTSLNVMFICSVSTVIFNANPLLKYDGYYILSDLLEIPNLREKAGNIVTHKLGTWCLGLEEPADRYLPHRGRAWFALYAVAAVIYRWVVAVAIVLFLCRVLEPYGLKVLGQLAAVMAAMAMLVPPLWQLKKFFSVPGKRAKIQRRPALVTAGLLGLAAIVFFAVPFPHRVYSPLHIQPHDATQVFVQIPGVLTEMKVRPGDQVQAGQSLALLDNLDARLEVARLIGERNQQQAQLDMLRRQRHDRTAANQQSDGQVPELEKSLASTSERLAKRQEELARLTLRSPCAGTILPPPLVDRGAKVEGGLCGWTGTPLDSSNVGTWLEEGELLCYVGDPRQLEAVLVVDQADIPFVREGQPVVLCVSALAGRALTGTVAKVSAGNLAVSPHRLSAKYGGSLDTRTDPQSREERPASTSYQASVVVDNADCTLRQDLTGQARIHVGTETFFTKTRRYLARTFHFAL